MKKNCVVYDSECPAKWIRLYKAPSVKKGGLHWSAKEKYKHAQSRARYDKSPDGQYMKLLGTSIMIIGEIGRIETVRLVTAR
jgi:hypothetical protein